MLHLSQHSTLLSLIGIVVFLPQLALIVFTGYTFSRHIELAVFLQTAVFATYNKVVTSQVSYCTSRGLYSITRIRPEVYPRAFLQAQTRGPQAHRMSFKRVAARNWFAGPKTARPVKLGYASGSRVYLGEFHTQSFPIC